MTVTSQCVIRANLYNMKLNKLFICVYMYDKNESVDGFVGDRKKTRFYLIIASK